MRMTGIITLVLLGTLAVSCTSREEKIEVIIAEYAQANPKPVEANIGVSPKDDRDAYIAGIERQMQKWAQTMDPYVARIRSVGGESAAIVAESARRDGRELVKMTLKLVREGAGPEDVGGNREWQQLSQRVNFSHYALGRMEHQGAEALGSILGEEHLGRYAAIQLGRAGQRDVLLKHFRDKSSTLAQRTHAAQGLTIFFNETEPIEFLVGLFCKDANMPPEVDGDMLIFEATTALSGVPKQAVPVLLKALEEGRTVDGLLWYLRFLSKHGLDVEGAIRLRASGKSESKSIFAYAADTFPQEKVRLFLKAVKSTQAEGQSLVAQVGGNVRYLMFEKLLALCEEAGIYSITLDVFGASELLKTTLLSEGLFAVGLAEPVEPPRVSGQTLFVEIVPVTEPAKEDGKHSFVLKLRQYVDDTSKKAKATYMEIPFSYEGSECLTALADGLDDLSRSIQNRCWNYCPTATFKSLPVVLEPPAQVTMDVVISVADAIASAGVKNFYFRGHAPGGDWMKLIENSYGPWSEGKEKSPEGEDNPSAEGDK